MASHFRALLPAAVRPGSRGSSAGGRVPVRSAQSAASGRSSPRPCRDRSPRCAATQSSKGRSTPRRSRLLRGGGRHGETRPFGAPEYPSRSSVADHGQSGIRGGPGSFRVCAPAQLPQGALPPLATSDRGLSVSCLSIVPSSQGRPRVLEGAGPRHGGVPQPLTRNAPDLSKISR